jgi:hypothetical protein
MKIISGWLDLTNDLLRQVKSTVKAHALTEERVLFCCPTWAIIVNVDEYTLVDDWLEYVSANDWLGYVNDETVHECVRRGACGIAAPNSDPCRWET